MSRETINLALFNTLEGIYREMGRPIPARPPGASGGKGAYTNWLKGAIQQGQNELTTWRNQQSLKAATEPLLAKIEQKQPTLTTAELSSTLESGRGGLRAPKLKVGKGKNIAKLKTAEYINPMGGGMTATPYGSSLNLA